MVAAVSVENTQSDVSVISGAVGGNAVASQSDTIVIFNIPSDEVQASQTDVSYISLFTSEAEVAQADVIAIVRGRVENPTLRAWTFSLDGHEFYVLRLGQELTLVYDTYSQQWVDWQSGRLLFWRPSCGINWIGGEIFAPNYGSNIVAGDDTFGLIWFLDPELPLDQSPIEDSPENFYFNRITMGQISMKGREVMPCYAAFLTADMGDPAYPGAGVRLETSDDGGVTFDDHGLVTVTEGVFTPEISWYSLGQIEAPGRLFRITDDGAVTRIDGLEMNDPDDDG